MKRSENCADLSAALAKAQLEMSNPSFDSSNPHFRSKFASLAAVRNAVIPVMAKHGISVTQELTTTERGVACLTVLHHASGQFMEFGPLEMPASKMDAQGFGSASTYAKRYSLQAVGGVVGDEDDDGNAASGKGKDESGKPDTAPVANDPRILAYAARFRDAMDADEEESVKARMVYEVHEELNKLKDPNKAELYVAAANELPANYRNAIKTYVAQHKRTL